ncbi:UbiX family flavin prenyltransferase [Nocardia pseudobrasiliensis]|uniref:Flavin prenyltransferase UbiX n=1 Tax=Nocardia pseudobrasiliensis TaxID=45979 RepID=A0A370I898_9NOCA|nr:UbiX family flavin prenyltransferase [Nocardia pseudobrasiliensis]RDI66932.1 4-hydroxy-3-polyprenylbenzoate decarboxylase [Nocardia pseudobrasiliensis]
MRLIVAMTGATGAALGVRLLEKLRTREQVETHLVISRWARSTIEWETGMSVREVAALADVSYSPDDQSAAPSSGSFRTDGMVIVPASMKTVAAVRHGYADGLVARAADVTLKEQRKLIIVPREAPLSAIHLENMLALARLGVMIIPPMPAFYRHPVTVDDVVDGFTDRLLAHFGLDTDTRYEWTGFKKARTQELSGADGAAITEAEDFR